jgi:Na+/H+-dicarboxylate symporter
MNMTNVALKESVRQARGTMLRRLAKIGIALAVGIGVGAVISQVPSLQSKVLPILSFLSVFGISAVVLLLPFLVVSETWNAAYGRKWPEQLVLVTAAIFAGMVVLAMVFGAGVAHICKPGQGLQITAGASTWWAQQWEWLSVFTARWIVTLHLNPNYLGLILLTIFVATLAWPVLGLLVARRAPARLQDFHEQMSGAYTAINAAMQALHRVSMTWMEYLLRYLFILVGVVALTWVGANGLSALYHKAGYLVLVLIGASVVYLAAFMAVQAVLFRSRAAAYWKAMLWGPIVGLTTGSAAVAQPVSEALAEEAGLNKGVIGSVFPMGARLNAAGTALYISVMLMVFLQAVGAPFTVYALLTMIGTALVLSMAFASSATPLVPRATVGFLAVVGLNQWYTQTAAVQMVLLIFLLDVVFESLLTAMNVASDCGVALLVDGLGRRMGLLKVSVDRSPALDTPPIAEAAPAQRTQPEPPAPAPTQPAPVPTQPAPVQAQPVPAPAQSVPVQAQAPQPAPEPQALPRAVEPAEEQSEGERQRLMFGRTFKPDLRPTDAAPEPAPAAQPRAVWGPRVEPTVPEQQRNVGTGAEQKTGAEQIGDGQP